MEILTLKYPNIESVKNEVQSEINAYIHAITVLSSLQTYLKDMNIECYIEVRLWKKDGTHKTPDLLIHSANYIIVDHKYTESENEKTLTGKLEEMKAYNTTFMLKDIKSKLKSEFAPEVVMLTPQRVVKYFKGLLNCPITWGYELDSEIVIRQTNGAIKDSSVSSLFNPNLSFPVAEEISKYKFFISHPPLPYAACQIFNLLFTLIPPTQYFSSEFEVKYNDILEGFNNIFPPWVRREVKQLNVTRLGSSLNFLQKVGWIKWFETEKIIIVYKNKGRQVGDLLSYLVEKYVKMEHSKRVKQYERRLKKLEALKKPPTQRKLMDFA